MTEAVFARLVTFSTGVLLHPPRLWNACNKMRAARSTLRPIDYIDLPLYGRHVAIFPGRHLNIHYRQFRQQLTTLSIESTAAYAYSKTGNVTTFALSHASFPKYPYLLKRPLSSRIKWECILLIRQVNHLTSFAWNGCNAQGSSWQKWQGRQTWAIVLHERMSPITHSIW